MLRFVLFLAVLLFLPMTLLAEGDTGVQARVLPQDASQLLEIVDWHMDNLSDYSVSFVWQSNLAAKAKIEYGETWIKDQSQILDEMSLNHEVILQNLSPCTL